MNHVGSQLPEDGSDEDAASRRSRRTLQREIPQTEL